MDSFLIRTNRRFLGAAAGTAAFALIYEMFSHQVYSRFLILAFLFPLIGGALPCSLLLRLPHRWRPGIVVCCLYDSGLVALTAGSIFRGILEIYGTTSRLSVVFWVAGLGLIALGLTLYVFTICARSCRYARRRPAAQRQDGSV